MLRYFAGLSVFCSVSENQPKYTQVSNFLSFCLGIDSDEEFIMNAFDSRSTSIGQLQKYAARAKLLVFQLDLLFLYFNEIANYSNCT